MYYIHHFAHHETLRRACDWLGQLGFHPDGPMPGKADSPWLTLSIAAGQLAEVELLVNAAENTDPLGWPGFWDEAGLARGRTRVSSHEPHPPRERTGRVAIGWHPIDAADILDRAELERLREAMGR
jgi:hypothetical protein